MTNVTLGPLRFTVEHRQVGPDGGPSLRVHDGDGGRELLRFDCFAQGPHWHADPDGRDVISKIESDTGPVDWLLAELRRDLAGYLACAGFSGRLSADTNAALDLVEKALRNPSAS